MPRGIRKNNPEAVAKAEAAKAAQQAEEARIRADERERVTAELQAEQASAVAAPAIIRKMVESQENTAPSQPVREFDANGNIIGTSKIQSPDSHHLGGELESIGFDANGKRIRGKKWHDEMAFANEMVTVRVHPSTDKNAHPLPDVYVNGRVQRFPRGEEITVRRCFVERLARAMATTYGNMKVKDVNGEDKYVYPPSTAEIYPFTVIGDTAKGEAWLKSILRSPQ